MGRKAKEITEAVEVEQMAVTEVIPEWHPHLKEATIKFVFIDGIKRKGREVQAFVRKATTMEHYLCGAHFFFVTNKGIWDVIDRKTKLALVDHELHHIGEDFEMVDHDIQEFLGVLKRHGVEWDGVLKAMKHVVNQPAEELQQEAVVEE